MQLNTFQSHRNRPYPFMTETGEGSAVPRFARKPKLYANWFIGADGQLTCRWETER